VLVREKEDGLWTLPGGWVDVGESSSESVEREVKEESGFDVRAVRLLALWDRDKHPHPPTPFHVYKLVFRCELLGGDLLTTSTETEGVGFFPKDALPELSLSRVTPQQIQGLIERAVDASNRRISTSSPALSGARMTLSHTLLAQAIARFLTPETSSAV
jgi:ADP-ribose pyrophosphatase YjhB (NUDIX family)